MIIDARIYTDFPGQLAESPRVYCEKAWHLQLKHLERCDGWYTIFYN